MAGGGNFMNRVVSYLVNELLVDSLANSANDDSVQACNDVRYDCKIKKTKELRPFSIFLEIMFCILWMRKISRAFQRFAVKTSKRIEDIQNIAAKKKEQLAEQMKDFSKNMEDSFKDR